MDELIIWNLDTKVMAIMIKATLYLEFDSGWLMNEQNEPEKALLFAGQMNVFIPNKAIKIFEILSLHKN